MYQNKKIGVIIAAAGSGTRMGGGISKQFRNIEGVPVLTRAVRAFDCHPFVDEIVVVTKEDSLEFCRIEMIAPFSFARIRGILPGGATRQDSVYAGLLALGPDADIVLVHDGARPFVSERVISDSVRAAAEREAAVAAVPVKDTIKVVSFEENEPNRTHEPNREHTPDKEPSHKEPSDREPTAKEPAGVFTHTPDRSVLYAVQTPQAFSAPLLRRAMEKAFDEKFYGTDDSVLVERLGKKVYLVKGDYENIKITTAEDMEIGAAIARRTQEREAR